MKVDVAVLGQLPVPNSCPQLKKKKKKKKKRKKKEKKHDHPSGLNRPAVSQTLMTSYAVLSKVLPASTT